MNISHGMEVQCETNEKKLLSEKINNFWNLDVLGISADETAKEGNFNIKLKMTDIKSNCHLKIQICS